MRFSVVNSKMASAKSLEDMLSSEVDESVVSAIVGSLESQLSSPNIHMPSQDIASSTVIANHISNSPVPDGGLQRLHDAQKQHGVPVGNLNQVQGNSLSSSTKSLSLTSNSQLLGINSVVSSAPSATNTLMVTLSGAVPASGYINQMTGTTQQTLLNAAVTSTSRSTNSADIKIVYSQPSVTQFNSSNPTSVNNGSVIQTQRSGVKPQSAVQNGGVNINVNRPTTTVVTPIVSGSLSTTTSQPGTLGMSAIQNLANVAAQQTPIIISNVSQAPGGAPNFAIQNQQLSAINSKQLMAQRMTVREQLDQKQHVDILGVKSQVIVKDGSSRVHQSDSGGTPPSTPGILPQTNISSNIIVSSTPTVITVSKPVQSQHGQPVNVVTQVLSNPNVIPGVQIVNMNARPGAPNMGGQRALAPRVVISNQVRLAPGTPQLITARPGTPGVQMSGQNTITLPGMVRGGTLLFKTETGQFQVVNVPGLTPTSTSSSIPGAATYRLQTVQMPNTSGSPVVSAVLPQGQPSVTCGSMQSIGHQQQTMTVKLANTSATTTTSVTQPLTIHTTTTNTQSATTPSQMSPNTAKKKCKNFLSTLIRLATDQPEQVATNVKNLIQGLIDGAIMPEDFTNQLQKELNSSPQPCLVPFLKKSLPYLRHSLMTRELTIEGVRPPPPGAVSLPPPSTAIPQIQITQTRPPVHHNTVRLMTPVSGSALTAQLAQPAGSGVMGQQRFVAQTRLHPGMPQSKSILVTSLTKPSLPNTAHTSAAVLSPATVGALQSKITPTSRIQINMASGSKEKEKRTFSSLRDDDDINDVAAMGGVNLVEESQRILAANAEIVGTQIRSCKDENFCFTSALQKRINRIASKYGLDDTTSDTVALISHATQERLKTLVEKLGVIAEHRLENIKNDPRFEVTQDVKGQLKFLEELDRLEKKRHEEQEREILLRAAKSRSKLEDPEQLKLKQKAKEMQRAELEEMRQREANLTALLAIGPRKKQKTEMGGPGTNQMGPSNVAGISNSLSKPQMRPRVKRVNLRDLLFLMEQEKETVRSSFLYKSYLK